MTGSCAKNETDEQDTFDKTALRWTRNRKRGWQKKKGEIEKFELKKRGETLQQA